MSITKIRKSSDVISSLFNHDKFISHKESLDVLEKSQSYLPRSKSEFFRTFLNPFSLIAYLKLKKIFNNYEDIRLSHNNDFIVRELDRTADFFQHIEFGLDEQQRRAVIADEDNALIIAGAGSGKTTTMVGKVKYLTEMLGVDSNSILPISFTKKSAEQLKDRINTPGIEPQTFHKFGLTALQTVENRKPAIFDEANSKKLFRSILEDLSKDKEYLVRLTNFFINYIKIPKSQFEFESLGDYIQYLKDQNFTTYKRIRIPHKGRETIMNETVKSIEECMIANFLTFNRVPYEYEKPYEGEFTQLGGKKSYKPDFTLENGVYLEHFGIDKDGKVPPFFAGRNESIFQATRSYHNSMEWKRKTHAQNGTTLIESYSYQFHDGSLLSDLVKNLSAAGIDLDPMTPQEIWDLIQNSGKDEVDGFIDLTQTFLALQKSSDVTVSEIRNRIEESGDDEFMKVRAKEFLYLYEPIYNQYESYLKINKMIDFNDMISRATKYISDGSYLCPLNYVIIDEFQDLSVGRYKILQAIKKQNPDVKFYCVGDDWQSIYRFAGSDITLFRDFENYFGYTYKAKIETTYRFNDPLITFSSEFILKNPNQTPKILKAPQGTHESHYSIIESDDYGNDDTDALQEAFKVLEEDGLNRKSEVFLIGRYNFDLKRIQNRNKEFIINIPNETLKYKIKSGSDKNYEILVRFVSAHRSKGLEADYVILINCNSGKYGFPSGKADDPLLNLLLSSADQYENGEERRLFYVAMTRTKRHVIFITDRYRKSKFIKEIQDNEGGRELSCPRCHNGELILRTGSAHGRTFRFYGCSNFAYGCTYSKSLKPGESFTHKQSAKSKRTMTNKNYETVPQQYDSPQQIEATTVTKSRNVAVTATEGKSILTRSELNRLNFFVSSPREYAFSKKGVEKVEFLKNISDKFNNYEKQQFESAYEKWSSVLRNRFDA
jgi:DNA helicase-4